MKVVGTVDQLALVPEAERSDSVRSMEMITMQAAIKHGIGSDRHLKVSSRLGELDKNAPATFESKAGEAFAHFMNGVLTTGAKAEEEKPDRTKLQTPSVQQAKEGFDSAVVPHTPYIRMYVYLYIFFVCVSKHNMYCMADSARYSPVVIPIDQMSSHFSLHLKILCF